ncbi:stress-activated map kinase interacting protein 1-domain-containing protein [Cantharellus anzutake]|uniref:stress-activated map kinase interacting protein 1-domain-containing protein n=1 Tax=Cantharellus anzutake TaxID=1750568 RepID=UPI00190655A8|nr:stress-activated map kinase interacting protein 1-domain-containing protein [Cantharellus anzutake]KAF8321089.1 stress-activated map kinase interacting protein 1-domain-containing protein [Cantharellus anzutake]
MSLISDTDYLKHAFRLAYLRHVEDSHKESIISLDPSYASNPHIRAAGLADPELWPEINRPPSPEHSPPSDAPFKPFRRNRSVTVGGTPILDDDTRVTGPAPEEGRFPGATGLRYTQTIMPPNRGGIGAGMRVSGRRLTASRASPFIAAPVTESRLKLKVDTDEVDTLPTPIPLNIAPATPTSAELARVQTEDSQEISRRRSSGGSTITAPTPTSTTNTNAASSSSPQVIQPDTSLPPIVAPKLARNAEMEFRRRMRMRARFPGNDPVAAESGDFPPPAGQIAPHPSNVPPKPLTFADLSDTESDRTASGSGSGSGSMSGSVSTSSGESSVEGEDHGEEADDARDEEFEGAEFLAPGYPQRRISMIASNNSDELSVLSGQLDLSVSQISGSTGYNSSLQMTHNERDRVRRSPVAESSAAPHPARFGAPLLPPPIEDPTQVRQRRPLKPFTTPDKDKDKGLPLDSSNAPNATNPSARQHLPVSRSTSHGGTPRHLTPKISIPTFRKKSLPPRMVPSSNTSNSPASASSKQPQVISALSQKLASLSAGGNNATGKEDNPFTHFYAAIAGRGSGTGTTTNSNSNSYQMEIYYHVVSPKTGNAESCKYRRTPKSLKVRMDACVEEVIGFALWSYWEEGCEPRLDEGAKKWDEEERKVKSSASAWCLRIVEDDGDVDDDFPVLVRTSSISRWYRHPLAVVEATPSQVKENLESDSKIVRRPSRLVITTRAKSDSTTSGQGPPSQSALTKSQAGLTPDAITSSALTGGNAPTTITHEKSGAPVFLKVRVAETADAAYYSTTIHVTTDTYLADVLDLVCKKKKITNPKDYALLLEDLSILLPLDRTVVSLERRDKLCIMKRALLETLGPGLGRQPGRATDPNASIFDKNKHHADLLPDVADFASVYKKYTIYRKIPRMFGSHERVLAIDGDYIHIMPSATRALLDSLKTSSYHIGAVVKCTMSKKGSASVKLIVRRETGDKRYDLEAENAQLAAEIVTTIRNLQRTYGVERSGSQNRSKSRRSRTSAVMMT